MARFRGEIWLLDLDPTRGHEQAGRRPALIISANAVNNGPSNLVTIVPLTTKARPLFSHLPVHPPEAGLSRESYIICDQVRPVSGDRLVKRYGRLSPATLREVEHRLRLLLDL